jgi:hypothetical protein
MKMTRIWSILSSYQTGIQFWFFYYFSILSPHPSSPLSIMTVWFVMVQLFYKFSWPWNWSDCYCLLLLLTAR